MNLFVYGTLLFPEIRKIVAGREIQSVSGTIRDYQIFRVNHADFPGVVSNHGSLIEGEILFDLTEIEIFRFDRYEDGFYIRTSVVAMTTSDPEKQVPVELYEIPDQIAPQILTGENWTKEWFEANHYKTFLKRLKQEP